MANKKKTIIHVNQHKIRANNKTIRENENWAEKLEPPLTVKSYNTNDYCDRADIVVDGKVVASVVHRPHKPLSCGARVWIETYADVNLKINFEAKNEKD